MGPPASLSVAVEVLGLGREHDRVDRQARVLEGVDAARLLAGREVDDRDRAVVHALEIQQAVLHVGAAAVFREHHVVRPARGLGRPEVPGRPRVSDVEGIEMSWHARGSDLNRSD